MIGVVFPKLTSAQSRQTGGVYEETEAEDGHSSASLSEEVGFLLPGTPESQHCPV